jgi:hypothetical protein
MNLRTGLLLITTLFLASCHSDEVVSEYPDLAEAKRAGAFERGWLPPVLPRSSIRIVESNDLDSNIGDGSFDFDPADLKPYLEQARTELAADTHEVNGVWHITIKSKKSLWKLSLPKNGKRATFNAKLLPETISP